MTFSFKTRHKNLNEMAAHPLDVLIIGGGITGAGIALQASAMGLRTGLVEMQDFAGGTSSRSTKLVHGGLRYLKQFEVEMVSTIAKERAVLHRNAPHVVEPQMMLLPIYEEKGASFTDFSGPIALDLYDALADVPPEWTHFFVNKEQVMEKEKALKADNLIKGGIYLDYTNDDARLTIEIVKKASELGALLVNYVKAENFLYNPDGSIMGAQVRDAESKESYNIRASVVVNATGPWADETKALHETSTENQESIFPTKGVHFVVDRERLPVNRPIYVDSGLQDERMIFIIPRHSKTYFGTTDTFYSGVSASPEVTQADVDYLLTAVNNRFPEANLTLDDIETSWAGLRPLVSTNETKETTEISRTHEIVVSDKGLITIAGGKLTDYRVMAEDVMNTIKKIKINTDERVIKNVDSRYIPLSGGSLPPGMSMQEYAKKVLQERKEKTISKEDILILTKLYGSNIEHVLSNENNKNHSSLPSELYLSLMYALEHEMVLTPIDFFLRRREYLLFDLETVRPFIQGVIQVMKEYFGWNEETTQERQDSLEKEIAHVELKTLKKLYRKI